MYLGEVFLGKALPSTGLPAYWVGSLLSVCLYSLEAWSGFESERWSLGCGGAGVRFFCLLVFCFPSGKELE